MKTNRRRFRRALLDSKAGISWRLGHFFAQSASLSEGGMMIRTETALRVFEHIEIMLILGKSAVNVSGVVVYAKPPGEGSKVWSVGIKFLKVPPADLKLIRDFVGAAAAAA